MIDFTYHAIFLRFAPENGFSPPLRSGENLHSHSLHSGEFPNINQYFCMNLFYPSNMTIISFPDTLNKIYFLK